MAGQSRGGGQDPRHPKSTFAARYPYNRVEVTEAGHERHYDDTPGKERVREAHMSGTYYEVSPDGKKTEQVVGNNIQYVKGGHTQTVDKNTDTKVHGSTRTSVSGDSHTETKGSVTSTTGGHSKSIVGGDQVSAVNGDSVQGVRGEMSVKVGKNCEFKSDANTKHVTDGNSDREVGGKDRHYVIGKVTFESTTEIELKVGASTITIKPESIWIDSPVVTVSKRTYIGQDEKGDTRGPKVLTEGGPAKQTWSLV